MSIQLTVAQLVMLRDAIAWIDAAGTEPEFYETNHRRWKTFEALQVATISQVRPREIVRVIAASKETWCPAHQRALPCKWCAQQT